MKLGAAKPMLAWKFIGADHRLRYSDKRELRAGEVLRDPVDENGKIVTQPVLCQNGFHASVSARDALGFAGDGMTHIARVEIGGTVALGDDKMAGTEIHCLWIADAEKALGLFAVRRRKAQMLYCLRGRDPSLAMIWSVDAAERFCLGDADTDIEEVLAARAAAYAACATDVYSAYAHAAHAAVYAAHAANAAANSAAYAAAYAACAACDAAADAEKRLAAEALETALLALTPKEQRK